VLAKGILAIGGQMREILEEVQTMERRALELIYEAAERSR
jgi:hypothetical protein